MALTLARHACFELAQCQQGQCQACFPSAAALRAPVDRCGLLFCPWFPAHTGEKIKFIQQSRTQLPAPNWRIAKESAAIITQDVIARFLQEGYVYRGKVALSKLPMFVKESTAADQVASTTTAADAAGGADTADVAASSTEGRNPTQAGNSSNNAQSEQKTASASSSTMVEVAVIRVDSSGNLYHKT